MTKPYLIELKEEEAINDLLVPFDFIMAVEALPDHDPYKPIFLALVNTLGFTAGVHSMNTHTVSKLLVALEQQGLIRIIKNQGTQS